jgi:hypothetical protein
MSGQTPLEGEGDWGDPIPPAPPPRDPHPSPPASQPPSARRVQPPAGPAGRTPPPQPAATTGVNNFLIPAVLSALFCCPPTGIVAIVFAAQANSKMSQGDMTGARASANKAKMWTLGTVGAGVVVWFLFALGSFSTY